MRALALDVARHFGLDADHSEPLGGGLIHATWLARGAAGALVLQRINTAVFADPAALARNVAAVCAHLRQAAARSGIADIDRRVLTPVPTLAGHWLATDPDGAAWRATRYIEHARVYTQLADPAQLRAVAAAYGRFQAALAGDGTPQLAETIPGFHDTAARFDQFQAARDAAAAADRRTLAAAECAALEREHEWIRDEMATLARGDLPTRIAHNDAKAANVLFDTAADEPLCVIDLDTVMPGPAAIDFVDLVRAHGSLAEEDAADATGIELDPGRFGALLDGYLSGAAPFMVEPEPASLLPTTRRIVVEQALRFLTDYLAGDRYYRTTHPTHNLERCRVQLALLASLDRQWPALVGMVREASPGS